MEIIEYKWKRTAYSKTFQVDRDKKKRVISKQQLHYMKDGVFTEIDLKPREIETGWKVETPYYSCEIIRFPFEVKINGRSFRNLDSPNTTKPEACKGRLFFPLAGIEVYFRPEGIDIRGKGTWKDEKRVYETASQTFNYGPLLTEFPDFDYPGEVISREEINGLLEVTFRHDQAWLHEN